MDSSLISAPLIIIRHGETDWNVEKRFQGHSDIQLNDCGRRQAVENARLLKRYLASNDADISGLKLLYSPLARASQTMEIIAGKLALESAGRSSQPALKEISFGHWEGLTSAQAKQQYYHQRQLRRRDRWSIAPPGGESFAERLQGVQKLLEAAGQHTVVFTHSGIVRIIYHLLQNIAPLEAVALEIPHVGLHVWDGNSIQFYC